MNTVFEYFIVPLTPILALVAMGILVLVLECIPRFPLRNAKLLLALAGPLISAYYVYQIWMAWPIPFTSIGYIGSQAWLTQFAASYHLDSSSLAFFAGIDAFTFLSLVFMSTYFHHRETRSEVLILTLFIAVGMMLLVSANTLMMVFLALELLSLPTYVLVGIQRGDQKSSEAALKYFLFGSFATVLLVFGIALLYAEFATFDFAALRTGLGALPVGLSGPRLLVLSSLALVLMAVGFKVGMVPFHMWLPDAYQGAPTPVTGFMGSAVKLAGFGLVMRLLWGLFLPLSGSWVPLINTLAVITMFVGNLAALQQENLKRMWAYSSISHAGYLLLAIGALPRLGGPNPSFLYYYLIVYGLMFVGFFAVLTVIERHTESTEIYQISGMGFTHPVLGACLAIFALSGAGIPPTAGFLAKYFVFLEAVKAGNTVYVVWAAVSSMIGAYYYLRVVVYLYMKESKERVTLPHSGRFALACIIACAFSMLFFSAVPQTLGLGLLGFLEFR